MRARFATLVCFSLLATTGATIALASDTTDGSSPTLSQSIVTAVLMERDRRSNPDAASHQRFGATGLVRCGNMVGTAQLVLHRDVIVTAAHVLVGQAARTDCVFMPGMGSGQAIAIDTATIRAGSRSPLSQAATSDWAVARLAAPVFASPYALAAPGTQPATVTLCAGGNGSPTHFGTETCAVRRVIKTAPDGIRELAIDCSGSPGGSGAALLSGRGTIAGIYVGDRSTNPAEAQPFSETHYNFGITIDGAFRRALLAEAGR